MLNTLASTALRERLLAGFAGAAPGCVFYVTRNGEPYADGSFGMARLDGAPDGAALMGPHTLLDTGSVGKFICAVAISRLIEEWNAMVALPVIVDTQGRRHLRPGIHVAADDAHLLAAAWRHNAPISLDSKMYPLLQGWLDQTLIEGYRIGPDARIYPGPHVREVTLRDLLHHTSGMTHDYADADLGGLTREAVDWLPADEGAGRLNLVKVVTAFLRGPAGPRPEQDYNNITYLVLAAVIEAATGQSYTRWVRGRLFSEARFADIDRKPVEMARAARYYGLPVDGHFTGGNHHPAFPASAAAGGWYMSASAFCAWVDTVMQKLPVGGRPLIEHPEYLTDGMLGMDGPTSVGRLSGATKNGLMTWWGGAARTRFGFMRGLADERCCFFACANGEMNIDAVYDTGLRALRLYLDGRPGPLPVPRGDPPADGHGLYQAVYFARGGEINSAAMIAAVKISTDTLNNTTWTHTNLLGDGHLAGGVLARSVCVAELRGAFSVHAGGVYVLRLTSDDGSALWLDDQLVIGNDFRPRVQQTDSAPLHLAAGVRYPLRVQWYNVGGTGALFLEWLPPGGVDFEPVPPACFTPGI